MYKITLADGLVLENIEVNGNTFISHEPINNEMFDHNLSPVDIELIGDKSPFDMTNFEGHHENMTYAILPYSPDGIWEFVLSDIPESEMRIAKMASDIEYMAMMNDIEL